MNRRRVMSVCVVSVACGACGLVLGIDGDVVDRSPPEGGSSEQAPSDAGPPVLVVDVAPPPLLQGGTVDVRVRRAAGQPGETKGVTLGNLPPGVTTTTPPGTLAEGESLTVTLIGSANASLGRHELSLVGSDVAVGQLTTGLTVTGNVDTTFGDGGVAIIPFKGTAAQFAQFGLSIDGPSGDIYVAFARDNGPTESTTAAVARYRKDGALDLTFATNGFLTIKTSFEEAQAHAVFSDPAGGVVVFSDGVDVDVQGDTVPAVPFTFASPPGTLGTFTSYPGSIDEEWATANVARDPDGGFIGLTTTTNVGGAPQAPLLSRTDARGVPITTFFGINKTFSPIPGLISGEDLVVGGDGSILVFGAALGIDRLDTTVTRRLPKGVADPTFGDDAGLSRVNEPHRNTAHAGAIEDGGTILFAGDIQPKQGSENTLMRFGRLDDRGRVVPTFGDGGIVAVGGPDPQRPGAKAWAVAPLADGRFLAAGALENLDNDTISARVFVARFQNNGSIDPAFAWKGFSLVDLHAYSEGRRMAWQKDKVIVAVLVDSGSGTSNIALIRYVP